VERRKEPTLFCSAGGSRSGAQSSALPFGSSRCSQTPAKTLCGAAAALKRAASVAWQSDSR